MKITMRVPTQQNGYLEAEGTDEDLSALEAIYNRYAEKPLVFRGSGDKPRKLLSSVKDSARREVVTFTDEVIFYDPEAHCYTTKDGTQLLSATKYAAKFETPFDKDRILPLTAKKRGVDEALLGGSWDAGGEVSRLFGTAFHKAMESWFKFRAVGWKPKHPFLAAAVESCPIRDSEVFPEIMVSSIKLGLAGQVDGLVVLGQKRGEIIDFKSDGAVEKNLEKHSHQLSFYAHILEQFGWTIEAIKVLNYTDKWKVFNLDRQKIEL